MVCDTYKIAVVGTGYVGLATAIGLARLAPPACNVVCLGPPVTSARIAADTRSTALFPASLDLLTDIGVWPACAETAWPLKGIRLVDNTGTLLRAPEICFRADDVGFEALAHNVPNAILLKTLARRASTDERIALPKSGNVTSLSPVDGGVEIQTEDGSTFRVEAVIGADGRTSICRKSARIETESWAYEQTAIALEFAHTRPHDNISTEFHGAAGPCTTVPGRGNTSYLVWVETPSQAKRIHALGDNDFRSVLEDQLCGLLGSITDLGARALFPIQGLTARAFANNRIFLAGEAAHVLPPIGAQGLNLGFRDIAALIDCFARHPDDPGSAEVCRKYDGLRRDDVVQTTAAVDLLNRSLLTSSGILHGVRGAGLHILRGLAPLRRATMRAGLGPKA